MTKKSALTDQEAEAMLEKLREHYGQPVMPVNKYCDALRTWRRAMEERASHLRKQIFPNIEVDYKTDPNGHQSAWNEYQAVLDEKDRLMRVTVETQGKPTQRDYQIEELRRHVEVANEISHVELLISKSSLLDRLIYGGEQLRTERCPVHDGTWCGLEFGDNCCPYKCQLTGWVMHPVDEARLRAPLKRDVQ